MKKYLLPNDVNWYRANFHCHTVCSDGAYTPEKVKEVYKNHGYSIVAYSDHEILLDHSDLNDDEFLALTSCEYSITEENLIINKLELVINFSQDSEDRMR